jgi:hypothetical protein
VSADLSSPVAGLRSLLMQALHPLAMAGVDQHSGWRRDPVGRRAATTGYIASVRPGCAARQGKKFKVRFGQKARYELDGGARPASKELRIEVHPGSITVSQSGEDLARLAEAGTAVCPTLGQAGTLVPPPNAVAVLGKLGMTMEQVVEMRKRRVAQMHAAGVRIVSGSDGGIAAAKPHSLLPVSVAFLVEGGVSTVAALASATALAADACGLGDRKGRLRAGYDADLLVVDGDPVADISRLTRPTAVFTAGQRTAGA